MKVRNYLESIAGVGIFPVIPLLLFFFIFCAFGIWAFRSRRVQFEGESLLPLEDGSADLLPTSSDKL